MAEVRRFEDADELGRTLAGEIVELSPRLLGCPGGRSLLTTYKHLPDLPETTVVMMDEYVPVPPPSAHYSCRGFAERELPRTRAVWLPDPERPDEYDVRIDAAGGIDLFLLASGASDGHVAFLPPGSPRDGRTSVVQLAESTRRDNLATFPEFESLDDVPTHGVSVGLATIADARRLRLVLHGPHKRDATEHLLALDRFDPSWPASIVHDHDDAEILVAP
jgi:glucosamine-6-phosphate deaminase